MSARYLCFVFIAVLAASPCFAQQLPAQAQVQLQQQSQPALPAEPTPDIAACVANFQCAVVDACGDKAVNIIYAAAFHASSGNLKCKVKKPFHANAVARCLNKKCIVMKPGS